MNLCHQIVRGWRAVRFIFRIEFITERVPWCINRRDDIFCLKLRQDPNKCASEPEYSVCCLTCDTTRQSATNRIIRPKYFGVRINNIDGIFLLVLHCSYACLLIWEIPLTQGV